MIAAGMAALTLQLPASQPATEPHCQTQSPAHSDHLSCAKAFDIGAIIVCQACQTASQPGSARTQTAHSCHLGAGAVHLRARVAGLDSAGAVAVSELQAAHGLDSHRRLDTVPHTDGQLVGDSALHDIIVYTNGI